LKAQIGIDLPLQRLIGLTDSGGFGDETLLWTSIPMTVITRECECV